MCGIVGLFAKSSEIEASLGLHLAAMLGQMGDRGPDSAGVAVYRDPAPSGSSKLTLFSPDPLEDWDALCAELGNAFGGSPEANVRSSHAVVARTWPWSVEVAPNSRKNARRFSCARR